MFHVIISKDSSVPYEFSEDSSSKIKFTTIIISIILIKPSLFKSAIVAYEESFRIILVKITISITSITPSPFKSPGISLVKFSLVVYSNKLVESNELIKKFCSGSD